ncbi:MAG: amino acid--[acyl-carrier-protein] ligase [Pseudomonadales bacterium]
MANPLDGDSEQDGRNRSALTDSLVDSGVWVPSSVPGLVGYTEEFEQVVEGIDRLILQLCSADNPSQRNFPPVLPRKVLAETGYMGSFPELCGCVTSFQGDERAHIELMGKVDRGEDWSQSLAATEVALTPAVCYPLYPTLADNVLADAQIYSLSSFVFRHEPSDDPARLQSFRMRENVFVGRREDLLAWRRVWIERAQQVFAQLSIPVKVEIASDPFFGRGGKMLKANQRADEGKFELMAAITSESSPTAIASFNYHQEKFSSVYNITMDDTSLAQTGCVGFGLERCALALFAKFGTETDSWPKEVLATLGI